MFLAVIQVYLKFTEPATVFDKDSAIISRDILTFGNELTSFADSGSYTGEVEVSAAELFRFDPNKVSVAEMKRLGLSNNVIRNLYRYRLKGGIFRKKEDLLRIYGMDQIRFMQLSPYIIIAAEERKAEIPESSSTVYPRKFGINMADSAAFESLPGIGPVFAKRIVRYRSLLGGYCALSQLSEVYGIPDSTLHEIRDYLYIDTLNIRKININEATEAELSRHPYIGRHTAKGIVNYRKQVKYIQKLKELIDNGILTKEAAERLENYLVI